MHSNFYGMWHRVMSYLYMACAFGREGYRCKLSLDLFVMLESYGFLGNYPSIVKMCRDEL